MTYENLQADLYKRGNSWTKQTHREILQYAIGALLYTPANHDTIGSDIIMKKYPYLTSVAFCLEDTIMDESLEFAEKELINTLTLIQRELSEGRLKMEDIPLLFIRVRSPQHMKKIMDQVKEFYDIITGFVLPKFSMENARAYQDLIFQLNEQRNGTPIYIMPILESSQVIDVATRAQALSQLKCIVDEMRDYVLNVRIGGNDLCSVFGMRRGFAHTIYDIGVIRDVLMDIMNIFGRDYVISAPVWEYFATAHGREQWEEDFIRELQLDQINGFVGKTTIHPSQVPLVQRSMVVKYEDYMDAQEILHWKNKHSGVEKGNHSQRMNEIKVHEKWAKKVEALSNIYGVGVLGYHDEIGK